MIAPVSDNHTEITEVPATGSRAPRMRLSASEHKKRALKYKLKRTLTAYAFLAPNFVFFIIFLLVPVVWVFWLSLHKGGLIGTMEFAGLNNYKGLFKDGLAIKSMLNSLKYAAIALPTMLIIGMTVALIMQNIKRGAAVLRAGIYFPNLAPAIVAALIWLFMYHPDFGALNIAVRYLGGEPLNYLGSKELALPAIAALEVWRSIGFWAVFFMSALSGLPKELYEAARLDGTSALQRFRHLTLPLLRPNILFALVLATIFNLQIFDTIFILTNGGPGNATATIVWYIYKTLFTYSNIGYGAALSFILLIVILALSFIQMRLLGGRRRS